DRRPDRQARGVLQRYARRAAGVRLRREIRIPVPGTTLSLAAAVTRHAVVESAAERVRGVFAEPRSGGELCLRPSRRSTDEPGTLAGDDRAPVADAGVADAVSGPGILGVRAVPVLRGSRSRAGAGGPPRTRGVPPAVSEHQELRARRGTGRSGRRANVRTL